MYTAKAKGRNNVVLASDAAKPFAAEDAEGHGL
jgi:hypothetical protein